MRRGWVGGGLRVGSAKQLDQLTLQVSEQNARIQLRSIYLFTNIIDLKGKFELLMLMLMLRKKV